MTEQNKLIIETLRTADLIPYANNSRTHSDEQINQIASSISEFGFNKPVLIDANSGLIAGHGRVMAAKKLGIEELPCLRLEHLSEAQKKAYIIADNKLALNSDWNIDILTSEMTEIGESFPELIDICGFSDKDIQKLFDETGGVKIEDELEEVDEMSAVVTVPAWAYQKCINTIHSSLADVPGVKIEQI